MYVPVCSSSARGHECTCRFVPPSTVSTQPSSSTPRNRGTIRHHRQISRSMEGDMVTSEHKQFYDEHGYVLVKGLFSPEEVERYVEHYMTLRKHGEHPGDFSGVDATNADP